MNRLVIIGNGFDMAHGLKTSYMDFINWYWNQRVDGFAGNISNVSEDTLCKLSIKDKGACWNVFAYENSYFRSVRKQTADYGSKIIQDIQQNRDSFAVKYCPLFKAIIQSIEHRKWVDIENDYYRLLKDSVMNEHCNYTVSQLNDQLAFLQAKLVEYLGTIEIGEQRKDLQDAMTDIFDPVDFSTEGKKKAMENLGVELSNLKDFRHNHEILNKLYPERIMLLSFNYTDTAKRYGGNTKVNHNYIHGELESPENIIFGYGDELDKNYQDILDMNDNELLKNVKSVKYLETRRYHELLEFLMAAPFQVLIMGHSCGNSDRTLLNTVFEHENCVSIKPYYHVWEDGRDNYLELVQNISRNFTNMKLFRDRVVNKEQCKTM